MGIYGVTSYAVAQRTQEIRNSHGAGARMGDVLKLILKGGMSLALIGAALGILGAFATTGDVELVVRSGANRRGDFAAMSHCY